MNKSKKIILACTSGVVAIGSLSGASYLISQKIISQNQQSQVDEEDNIPIDDNVDPQPETPTVSNFFEWPSPSSLERAIFYDDVTKKFLIDEITFEYLFIKELLPTMKKEINNIKFEFYEVPESSTEMVCQIIIEYQNESFIFNKKYAIQINSN